MSRGNRKSPIFDDDEDRRRFMATLSKAVLRYGIRLYAWCLMTNHYHLVFDTPRGNLSDAMRHINGVYTQASNRLHRRTGHVYEGRFRSIVVQRESYLRRVARYVVLNPVRAHLTAATEEWPWSSYGATAGTESAPPYLYSDWIDWAFPSASRDEAQRKYCLFVNNPVAKKVKVDLSVTVLGSDAFESAVRGATTEAQPDGVLPRVYRSLGRPPLEALFGLSMPRDERNQRIRRAHVEYGYRLSEVAIFLGLHPSTASLIVRELERVRRSPQSGRRPSRHRAGARQNSFLVT